MPDGGIPDWYIKALIQSDDDTLLLDWELDEGGNYHRGYCKFCRELLYASIHSGHEGGPVEEYNHMVTNHAEQVAMFRIGAL